MKRKKKNLHRMPFIHFVRSSYYPTASRQTQELCCQNKQSSARYQTEIVAEVILRDG